MKTVTSAIEAHSMQGFTRILVLVMMCLSSIQMVSADQLPEYRYFKIEFKPHASGTRYSVQMFADGTMFYEGGDDNKEVGFRIVHKSSNEFQKVSSLLSEDLFQSYRKMPCVEEETSYRSHGTQFFIEDRTRETKRSRAARWRPKAVVSLGWCPQAQEREFQTLFQQIEQLVNVEELTGTRDEQEEFELCYGGDIKECRKINRTRKSKGAAHRPW